jgi:hypothetical protein
LENIMSQRLVERYHNAWTHGDFDTARTCLADDLDFKGSIDTFHGADALMAPLYDCDTVTPAGLIRTAEFFTILSGD